MPTLEGLRISNAVVWNLTSSLHSDSLEILDVQSDRTEKVNSKPSPTHCSTSLCRRRCLATPPENAVDIPSRNRVSEPGTRLAHDLLGPNCIEMLNTVAMRDRVFDAEHEFLGERPTASDANTSLTAVLSQMTGTYAVWLGQHSSLRLPWWGYQLMELYWVGRRALGWTTLVNLGCPEPHILDTWPDRPGACEGDTFSVKSHLYPSVYQQGKPDGMAPSGVQKPGSVVLVGIYALASANGWEKGWTIPVASRNAAAAGREKPPKMIGDEEWMDSELAASKKAVVLFLCRYFAHGTSKTYTSYVHIKLCLFIDDVTSTSRISSPSG
ncbi:hypothetical protein CPC08DRAFT_788780 [Agrocybe pediades]|nr:hypothetical protein CPC08DRAFT_788780 [Agrocybe pediades]